MEHTHYVSATASSAPVFNTYTDFAMYLKDRKCPTCNVEYIQSNKDSDALFQNWLTGKAPVNSHIKCRKCSKATCIACPGKRESTVSDMNGIKVSWCCSRGRLFIIWVMLCGFDQVYCDRKRREASTCGTNRNASSGSGVGYGSWADNNQLFSSRANGPMRRGLVLDDGKKAKDENAEKRTDRFDMMVFSFLAKLCPSPGNDQDDKTPLSSFDVRPPKAVVSMLVNSKILNKAAELLRNDSLDNATQRTDLYMALIAFLKRVGVHPVSKQEVIFNDRIILPDNVNLLTLSFTGTASKASETASSLADGLRRLNIQSDMMMRGAQKARNEFKDQLGQDMLWLCREISDLSTHLQIEEWWAQVGEKANAAAVDYGIVEVSDDQIWPTYSYTREARGLTQSPAGRIRRLITEITSLKTGLSSGIHVKHAMSRLDVMKILIIGPEGTPYENGLFEFDLWCGQEYPRKPPLVRFDIKNCSQSMNPNLHMDGKVCLSLLGTWLAGVKGEEWQPGQSTILQVLISIQAMIFCDDPIQNEPGFNGLRGLPGYSSGSSEYIKMVRNLVVRHAMLNWALNPPPLWKDIVNQHFQKSGDKTLKTVERWVSESSQSSMAGNDRSSMMMGGFGSPPLISPSVNIAVSLADLHRALKKYGATYVPRNMGNPSSQQSLSQGGMQSNPYDGGGTFNGPGGKSSFGASPGSRYGRGW